MATDEQSALTIRFAGPRLVTNGIPIYDLGVTFISLQRIIHKAYLATGNRLEKGKYPEKQEREQLSLQIGTHEKGSDLFGLIPVLTDSHAIDAIRKAVEFVIAGVTSYAVGKVLDNVSSEPYERKQIFIGSIQADIVNIVNRIDANGSCETIEIGSPRFASGQSARFDEQSRDYARNLDSHPFLGTVQTIKGAVFKLYPDMATVEMRRPGGRKCKVFLATEDFNTIRYRQKASPLIEVTDRPRYRIGMKERAFHEFEASSVKLLEEGED